MGVRPAISGPCRPQRRGAVRFRRSADDPARPEGRVSRGDADGVVRRHAGRLRTARLAAKHGPEGLALRRRVGHLPLGRVVRGVSAARLIDLLLRESRGWRVGRIARNSHREETKGTRLELFTGATAGLATKEPKERKGIPLYYSNSESSRPKRDSQTPRQSLSRGFHG